jgi:hypothetical protein
MSAQHAFRSGTVAAVLIAVASAQEPRTDPDPLQAMQRELDAARAELAELRASLDTPAIVSGSLGTTLTDQYLFRGIPQEDQGVIAQPWLELGFRLFAGGSDDIVQRVDLTAGIWDSLHDGSTGGAGGDWYESDAYAGLSVGLGGRWTIGASYTTYTSPNGSFGTVQEVVGSVAFDDTDLWLPIAMQPTLMVAFEVDGQADSGLHPGIYAEITLEPRVPLGSVDGFEFNLVVPLKLGLSVRDYYEQPAGGDDKTFGYFDAAVVLACTLANLPNAGKPWTVELGMHYVTLGGSNEARNHGENSELLNTLTLGTSF